MRDFSRRSLSKQVEYHSPVQAMSQMFAKFVLSLFVTSALLSAPAAWSQDDQAGGSVAAQEGADDTAAGETPEAPAAEEAEEAVDSGGPAVGLDEIPELDEQTYEKDDDEFVPTEEIPVDQSIPFPTDI